MQRAAAIASLSAFENDARRFGVTELFLFGSTARDEATSESDLDIFIDYDSSRHFSLIDLAGIKLMLEENLSINVDITTRSSLHPSLKAENEQSAVSIF